MAATAGGVMPTGLTTWDAWQPPSGPMLLIVNSAGGHEGDIAAICDELERLVDPSALHAVASADARSVLLSRGWASERVLEPLAGDAPLELNYFLESAPALQWILGHEFAVVTGSAAHSLHNDEVKDIFERRVALFLGSSAFLAHALPRRYVYVLGLGDLLHRMTRPEKVAGYGATSRALIDDLVALWRARGRPVVDDRKRFDDECEILARHLGAETIAFDEMPRHRSSPHDGFSPVAEFVRYAESIFHPALAHRDPFVRGLETNVRALERSVDDLRAMADGQQNEINRRDRILDELRSELDVMTSGWRRFVVRRR